MRKLLPALLFALIASFGATSVAAPKKAPSAAAQKKAADKKAAEKKAADKKAAEQKAADKKAADAKAAAKKKADEKAAAKKKAADEKAAAKKTADEKTLAKKADKKKTAKKPAPEKAAKAEPPKPYAAPRRTVNQIAFAIGITRPNLPLATRKSLATLLVQVANAHNFDALSGWAIIDHESHWRPDAVGPDGEDIGLAQIRYTEHRACRADRESEACLAHRAALMDPSVNIRRMAFAISAWRELCTKVTGEAPDMHQWLSGYGGYSRPHLEIYCNRRKVKTATGFRWKNLPTPKAVADILASRQAMIRRIQAERVR
jgi:hypothetical protein